MIDLQQEIDKIWTLDDKMQLGCLHGLAGIRRVYDEMAEDDINFWRSLGMFYVPDEQYLVSVLGNHITQYQYGLYREGYCTLAERVAIPIRTLSGQITGLIGYSNEEDIKYLFPPKHVLDKSRVFFCEPDWFRAAMVSGYICIVDGIFDAIRLAQNGIPAASLCGSRLTSWHKLYFSFIPTKFIIADNDKAGIKLARKCLQEMDGVCWIQFDGANDIDDLLKENKNVEELKKCIVDAKLDHHAIYRLTKRRRARISKVDKRPEQPAPAQNNIIKALIETGVLQGEVNYLGAKEKGKN